MKRSDLGLATIGTPTRGTWATRGEEGRIQDLLEDSPHCTHFQTLALQLPARDSAVTTPAASAYILQVSPISQKQEAVLLFWRPLWTPFWPLWTMGESNEHAQSGYGKAPV